MHGLTLNCICITKLQRYCTWGAISLHTNVPSNFIHNSQILGTTQMSNNRSRNTRTTLHPYNEILLTNKERTTDICNQMDAMGGSQTQEYIQSYLHDVLEQTKLTYIDKKHTSWRWRWELNTERHRRPLNDFVSIAFYNTTQNKTKQRSTEKLLGKMDVF